MRDSIRSPDVAEAFDVMKQASVMYGGVAQLQAIWGRLFYASALCITQRR